MGSKNLFLFPTALILKKKIDLRFEVRNENKNGLRYKK